MGLLFAGALVQVRRRCHGNGPAGEQRNPPHGWLALIHRFHTPPRATTFSLFRTAPCRRNISLPANSCIDVTATAPRSVEDVCGCNVYDLVVGRLDAGSHGPVNTRKPNPTSNGCNLRCYDLHGRREHSRAYVVTTIDPQHDLLASGLQTLALAIMERLSRLNGVY